MKARDRQASEKAARRADPVGAGVAARRKGLITDAWEPSLLARLSRIDPTLRNRRT